MRKHLHDQAENNPRHSSNPSTLPAGHNKVTAPTKATQPAAHVDQQRAVLSSLTPTPQHL